MGITWASMMLQVFDRWQLPMQRETSDGIVEIKLTLKN
jgi:hypothetical protein